MKIKELMSAVEFLIAQGVVTADYEVVIGGAIGLDEGIMVIRDVQGIQGMNVVPVAWGRLAIHPDHQDAPTEGDFALVVS